MKDGADFEILHVTIDIKKDDLWRIFDTDEKIRPAFLPIQACEELLSPLFKRAEKSNQPMAFISIAKKALKPFWFQRF